MKKIITYLIVINFLFILCSCSVSETPKQMYLEETEVNLTKGETYNIRLKLTNIEINDLIYSYDSEILNVENGVITAVDIGTSDVYISVNGDSTVNKVKLTINVQKDPTIPEAIECENKIDLIIGQTYNLTWNIIPETAIDAVDIFVSDKEILSMNGNHITALKEGSCIISIVSTENSLVRNTIEVNVTKELLPPTEIIAEDIVFVVGEKAILQYTIIPNDANQDVVIEISDPSIVSIDNKNIIGLNVGECTIVIKSTVNENIFKIINVTVITGSKQPL